MKSVFTALAILITCTIVSAGTAEDLFAVQKSANMNLTSPLGLWEIGPYSVNDMNFTLRMKFEQGKVTAANKCTNSAGQSAYVSLTAPATIAADTIAVTGSASNTVTQNGVNCDINVTAGPPKHFSIVNGVMTMEDTPITAQKISD